MVRKAATKLNIVITPPTKLDLGCGKNKKPGFHGVDAMQFEGVDTVLNLVQRDKKIRALPEGGKAWEGEYTFRPWPWASDTIEEVHCSHFLEHLEPMERVHFVNELWRVMRGGAKAQIIVPHWASNRAYGDLTHKWPPVSEMWFYYLNKDWVAQNAPHNDFYTCDFEATWGYSLHPGIIPRSQEYQSHALQFWKEAAQDMICTLTARKPAK